MSGTSSAPPRAPQPRTSSFSRAFAVVDAFTRLAGPVHGLQALAAASGLDDSSVYRILKSGLEDGTFEQVARGQYRLGRATVRAAMQAMTTASTPETTNELLERLHHSTNGGLALLYVLSPFGGARRLCTDYFMGESGLAQVGMTPEEVIAVSRSLRTGASGRAILAFQPERIQEQVLAEEVPPTAGPGAMRDNSVLHASLVKVRERGYAIGRQECMADWDSVAAPISWSDQVMGSVLLLMPTNSMPADLRPLIYHTVKTASQISKLTTTTIASPAA